MNFSLSREQIEKLGFTYIEDYSKCRAHYWNWIPLKVHISNINRWSVSSLKEIEADINKGFLEVLVEDIKDAKIQKIHSIEWTRMFRMRYGFDTRNIIVLFNVRLLTIEPEFTSDSHIISY